MGIEWFLTNDFPDGSSNAIRKAMLLEDIPPAIREVLEAELVLIEIEEKDAGEKLLKVWYKPEDRNAE